MKHIKETSHGLKCTYPGCGWEISGSDTQDLAFRGYGHDLAHRLADTKPQDAGYDQVLSAIDSKTTEFTKKLVPVMDKILNGTPPNTEYGKYGNYLALSRAFIMAAISLCELSVTGNPNELIGQKNPGKLGEIASKVYGQMATLILKAKGVSTKDL